MTRPTQNTRNPRNESALRVQRVLRAAFVGVAAASIAVAQPTTRRATNIAALLAYPSYFAGRPIVLIGKVAVEKDELRVSSDEGSIRLVTKGNAPDGLDEIRGELWDIGRMKPDDPRLSTIDLRTTFHIDPDGAWPKAGEVTAIVATAIQPAQTPPAPSIHAIVLNPDRYLDQKVTVTGQFSGRNLLGDLPDAPGRSRYDFVLRSADAAIWIINMRPRVRDANGKEIDLGLDTRLDTGRWLEVRGAVQQGHGLQWIDAEAGSLKLSAPPTETATAADEPVRVPAGPPPEAIFSVPTDEETDVASTTTVRIQFSRDLDPATLKGHVHAHYTVPATAAAIPIDVTMTYNAANREVEVKFAKPLERFSTVKIDLDPTILGTDGQPLKPFAISFSIGAS